METPAKEFPRVPEVPGPDREMSVAPASLISLTRIVLCGLPMLEWNIQSRAHACQMTGTPFVDGQSYHTVLLDQREGFERLDLGTDAWKEHGQEILARPNYVSHWTGTYEAPPAAPPEAIRKDDAESLLRRLIELADDRYAGATYILAVMLERKRLLRLKGQSREGGHRRFLYEHPASGDLFSVTDPDLRLDQLEQVQHDVAQLLAHGLPEPAGPVEEPFNFPSEVPTLAPA